ncbi:hypothetical protein [Laspinema olomoucense]|uniref:Uncharacterized protein n=1 Tax=Laspinema olomoucense D3b TaxID=2953688 RepID=A0ABT2N414_9CYAN|nr:MULTISPECIES: hypothetical protein [unclassified Laspinema]MCT7972036.1 hypothetical protein [Laspinema sp. D3d]MCT7976515.1 hypothetical protein [Laspinema sp. D3b]MCT7994944.1 hypothetical protein [Laspinema sp. D3c]
MGPPTFEPLPDLAMKFQLPPDLRPHSTGDRPLPTVKFCQRNANSLSNPDSLVGNVKKP